MLVNLNPFIDVQLSIDGNTVTIQYKVDPEFSGKGPYSFTLFAYEDETFEESLYSIDGHPNTFYIVDDTNSRQSPDPGFFYRLRLTTVDKQDYFSHFIGWHPSDHVNRHKYLLASDISRRERVRFNYTGLYVYLLKRKSYIPNQEVDVDPITGEPLTDNTSTFGVGSPEGYYEPVLTRISIEKKEIKTVFAEDGRGSQYIEILNVRSIGFPYIDQHDIVVTGDSKRYTVSDANSTYFPGTTMILLQSPVLRMVPNTDTIYNIPVPEFPDTNF